MDHSRGWVVKDIGRPRVSVARLPDGTDVDEVLASDRQLEVLRINAIDRPKLLLVNHRTMRVPVKAERRHLMREMRLGLKMVEDVAEVLRIVHRRMDERDAHFRRHKRQGPEKTHLLLRQLLARPFNDRRGMRIKILQVLPRGHVMVMVTHDDRTVESADLLQTLVRTGIVADNITRAQVVRHALFTTVRQHNLERIEVRVNVSEYRK